ncbi:MAG: FecR domain-containing protein [Sphingobacteriaceae bacterium]|nr:FecR domain-containing protein [Sphingobacteriaceae bacterium]
MDEELLIKFLLGETSSEENEQVDQWIAASPSNKKRFEQVKLIWNTSKNLASTSTIDEHAAWGRFQEKVSEQKVLVIKPRFQSYWLKIAAVLIFGLGFWGIYFLNNSSGYTTLRADAEVRNETLPDGTNLTINKHTKLSYASDFDEKERNVRLEQGEVFFKVTRNEAKPFIIQAGEVRVRVLGTSFNVKHTGSQTEVIVETGLVRVKLAADSVELRPNQKVRISSTGTLTVLSNTDQLYNYYITKQLVADNTPLWRVIEVLNEIYGAEISIEDDRIRNLPLNATFKEESLDTILNVICDTFRLKMIRRGNKIILEQ